MASFKVLSCNHSGFTVSDLDATVRFFVDALGFELLDRAPRNPLNTARLTGTTDVELEVAYMRFGNQTVEFLDYRLPDRQVSTVRPVDVGASHLALKVDDLDAAVEACRTTGGSMVGTTIMVDKGPNAGNRICYVSMQNGTTLELVEAGAA